MDPQLLASVVSFGGAGLLIYFLWQENKRLSTKADELQGRLDDQYKQRITDKAEAEQYLWQIGSALAALAKRVQLSGDGSDGADDRRLGPGAG